MALHPIEKKCYQCDTIFIPKHANTLCCSDKCKKARAYELSEAKREALKRKGIKYYHGVNEKEKVCVICEASFRTSNAKKICCSKECSRTRANDKTTDRRNELYPDSTAKTRKKSKPLRGISDMYLNRGKIHYHGLTL